MPDYRGNELQDSQILANFMKPVHESMRQANVAGLKQMLQSQSEQADLNKLARTKELAQQMQQENMGLAKNLVDEYAGKNKKISVGLTPGGGVNLTQSEQDDLLRALAIKSAIDERESRRTEREDERTERAVTTAGGRIEKEDIPGTVSQLKEIRDALPPEGQPLKSYGPWLNALPNWAVSGGEALKVLPEGARRERQAMEAGKALIRKPIFGATLTPQEKASFDTAFSAPIGGSEADVRNAVRRMEQIPIETMRNIESTTRPAAMSRIKERGGMTTDKLTKMLTPIPATAPADPDLQRYQELKRKHGR